VKSGLILFGHGSREPRWAEPFERLAQRVRARAPGVEVRLAFLETIAPDLPTASGELVAAGVTAIRVVPVFLGQGGHVRSDLPRLVEALRQRHPTVVIRAAPAVGEDDAVIEALATYCLRELGPDA
jgi:sirohydrochlorin cobaltochelatase